MRIHNMVSIVTKLHCQFESGRIERDSGVNSETKE